MCYAHACVETPESEQRLEMICKEDTEERRWRQEKWDKSDFLYQYTF